MAGVGRDHGGHLVQWALLKQSHLQPGVKDYVQRALSFPMNINSTTSLGTLGTLTSKKVSLMFRQSLRVAVCAVYKVSTGGNRSCHYFLREHGFLPGVRKQN